MSAITIRSEEEAWNLLREITKTDRYVNGMISFEGWPSIRLDFEGGRWNSSITTRIMEPILHLQREIYRIYANNVHGSSDIRCLSQEEKEALELVVHVHPGSTSISSYIGRPLTELLGRALERMEPKHVVTLVLGCALIWAGQDVAHSWLKENALEKRAIIEKDISADREQQETERMKILADAITQNNGLKEIKALGDELIKMYLVPLQKDDKLKIGNVSIKGEEAEKIIKKSRSRTGAEEIRIDGIFNVLKVDASSVDGFLLAVKKNGETDHLSVFAPWDNMSIDDRQLLKDAFWDRSQVELSINARKKRGKIDRAILFRVKKNGDIDLTASTASKTPDP